MTAADADETADDPRKPDEGLRRISGSAANAAAWAFAFLILRIFAVSGYDWNTAFAVSTTLGLDDGLSLLFGSLMAGHLLTAILLMCVLPLLIAASRWGAYGRQSVVRLLATLGVVILAALTVSFHRWWLPLATAALFGLFALIRRLPEQHRLRRVSMAAMARVGSVAGIAVLLVAALVSTPWVPREQIETKTGTVTGYVLSVDSGYLNVLTDEHEFVILISGDVISRR